MGSPKVARTMGKQRICRRRFSGPFAAVLVAAALAVVVFSNLFAQDPKETRGSPNKEYRAATSNQELDAGNSGGMATAAALSQGERSTGGSEKQFPLEYQEGEETTAKSGLVQYTKCTPGTGTTICDLTNQRYDICDLCGDARTIGHSSTVMYFSQSLTSNGEEWSIPAQSRKSLPWIKKVTIKSLNSSQLEPSCTSRHAIPAIVFALDNQVRCYPQVIVGLRSHQDIGIDPNSMPQNYTMTDFRLFVREAYGLPAPEVDIPYKANKDDPEKKPRIMLIDRGKTRRFMNVPDVIQGLEWFGFEVVKADPRMDSNLDEFVPFVDSCDAIMGVHGAGLTNMVFLRSGAVLVHIIPYGIEFMASRFYGTPAMDMGLRHVQYSISPDESTLLEKYGGNHTVIKDPEAIRNSGWEKVGEFYMTKQDIELNMTRFGPSMLKAIEFIT
ncbi:hypothetical protein BS78_K244000 [Paspalum vaginatum]|uniref:Glycosyltransferase 61 catalytic domain-containing protein n=1 Tax=Paspalum vaginatum TaxID=158149 RepID=A0A9W8CGQ5_9POAL|nr:hypothetical protein BS78_K244000 [Paspalum vaginatum]